MECVVSELLMCSWSIYRNEKRIFAGKPKLFVLLVNTESLANVAHLDVAESAHFCSIAHLVEIALAWVGRSQPGTLHTQPT